MGHHRMGGGYRNKNRQMHLCVLSMRVFFGLNADFVRHAPENEIDQQEARYSEEL